MCRPATCPTCSKASWAGCGQHVDQVLGRVPQADRCQCSPAQRGGGSLLSRLLGRR
jgi:hypothetical protein